MIRWLLFFLFCAIAAEATGGEPEKEVVLAANAYTPPYVFAGTGDGMLQQIARQALKLEGINQLRFNYISNNRALREVSNCAIDGALNIEIDQAARNHLYYSDGLLEIENIVVALKERSLTVNSVNDLAGLSVMGFQGAQTFLGSEFSAMTKEFKSYAEVVNQEAQIANLMKGWADTIVVERRVFDYYLNLYRLDNPVNAVEQFRVFHPRPRRILFCNRALRDRFNRGLATLKASPEYAVILSAFSGVSTAQ